MGKSMQAACKRLAGGLSQACSEDMRPEERLTAVAKGVDGLFEEITARYTPVLGTDVLNAVSLAAEQLYRLLTPQIQVWLSQGEHQAIDTSNTCQGKRLMVIAKGVDGPLERIITRHMPVLGADVLNAISLAAEQLHKLLTSQVQA